MAQVKVSSAPEAPKPPSPLDVTGVPPPPVSDADADGDYCLRNVYISADGGSGSLGLHLSRTPWDPYPWVSGVLEGSCADQAGVRVGDCVLEANGEDLLGLKIVEIAQRVRNRKTKNTKPGVSLLLWNSGFEKNNLNPQSLSRFATCLQGIAGLLECPVCLEIIRPPSWQCYHGHLICSGCRAKSTKCPICRVLLGRGRCIVADKLFNFLVQTLGQHEGDKHTAVQKPSNLQQINARLPLLARDHRLCKQSLKLKTNSYSAAAATNNGPSSVLVQRTPPKIGRASSSSSSSPAQYCCPSGQPCDKMKNQHDILIHLQKSHQTSVVQYYATPGDSVSIGFNESCVTCVVLVQRNNQDENNGASRPNISSTDDDSSNNSSTKVEPKDVIFFLAKFRCIESSSQALYWLWYLGEQEEIGRFVVTIADEKGSIRWTGRPISLRSNCKEVLKSKQFVKMDYGAKGLQVTVDVTKV